MYYLCSPKKSQGVAVPPFFMEKGVWGKNLFCFSSMAEHTAFFSMFRFRAEVFYPLENLNPLSLKYNDASYLSMQLILLAHVYYTPIIF